jgi:N utilization substance protein B
MSRKNAREDSFKLLFEALINQGEPGEKLEHYFRAVESGEAEEEPLFINKPTKNDNDYVRSVFLGIHEKSGELDEIIKLNLKGWELSRVSKISIALVRLALYEIMYIDEIPESVAINEAVELAKKYEGTESASFVNGILGSYVKGVEGL